MEMWNGNDHTYENMEPSGHHQSIQSDGQNGRRHGSYDGTGDNLNSQYDYRSSYSSDRNIVYSRSPSTHNSRRDSSYGQNYEGPGLDRQDSSRQNADDVQPVSPFSRARNGLSIIQCG